MDEQDAAAMMVNLGSGDWYQHGWHNVDHALSPHRRDETVDLAGELPWPPGSITDVYAGHVLEHLTREQCAKLLAELRPLMVPGGRIMVVGPDLDKARALGIGPSHTLDELRFGSNRWPGDLHQWECTTARVMDLLSAAGWSDVTDVGINQVDPLWPVVDREPQWQLAVSAVA